MRVAANLPGVTRVAVTPDVHTGYGVPIGIAIETDRTILPTAAGYDIGCGMVQLVTDLTADQVADRSRRRAWIDEVTKHIGIGVGAGSRIARERVGPKLLAEVVRHGAKALGRTSDVAERAHHEVTGDATPPPKSQEKIHQLGSIGGGNHFLEMQVEAGTGRVWVMIHTGSRGYGWNIGDHFFREGASRLGLRGSEKDRIWFDADSEIGRRYLTLHNMAANFAIANRMLIGEAVCRALMDVFGGQARIYYEISHNLVQREGGRFVHRKGATRAFPAGHPFLRGSAWEKTGHPILIPGSMATGSAILFAKDGSRDSIHSVNHGAGRCMSRGTARRTLDQRKIDAEMAGAGIILNTRNTPIDEAGACYKDLDVVLDAVETAGLAEVKVRLRPVACIKGND
jgi:tRNA-splicing ligase RtcB